MAKGTTASIENTSSLTAVFLMIFSAALLLLLIGMYLIVGLHSDNIVTYLKEHTAIVFELSEDVDGREDAAELILFLKKDDRLRSESVTFISAEDGLKFMQDEMGTDLLADGMDNPFRHLVSSFVKEAHTSLDELEAIRTSLIGEHGIANIYFQNDYLDFWDTWKAKISRVAGVSALFLLLITIMLIFNTVKLSVMTKKDTIEIFELVGASWDYIRRPFLRVAVKMGIISALLASIFIAFVLSLVLYRTPGLIDYFNWYYLLMTIGTLILLGVLLQWISSYIVVGRSLKQAVSTYK